MKVTYREIRISDEVQAGMTVAATAVPASSCTEVCLADFHGESAFTQNSVVKCVWDYGSENEEILWSTKGSSKETDIFKEVGGPFGSKAIAVVLENGENGTIVMSGLCRYWEKE